MTRVTVWPIRAQHRAEQHADGPVVGEPAGVEHLRRRASPAARQDMVDAVARDVLEAGGVDPAQVEVLAEDQTLCVRPGRDGPRDVCPGARAGPQRRVQVRDPAAVAQPRAVSDAPPGRRVSSTRRCPSIGIRARMAFAPPPLAFSRSGAREAIVRRTGSHELRDVSAVPVLGRGRRGEDRRPPGGTPAAGRDPNLPAIVVAYWSAVAARPTGPPGRGRGSR